MSPRNMSSAALGKSSPFDALAADYDRSFTHSVIGRAQRDAVWEVVQQVFTPGSRILELNCGTGVDAVYMARLGLKVTALDSSAQMIAVAQDRIRRERCESSVQLMHWTIEDLDRLPAETPYDGAFSNFGGLNCLPDLQTFGSNLAQWLKPGSPALLCLMGRYCVWEFLYYSLKWRLDTAVRRLNKDGVLATLGNSQPAEFNSRHVAPDRTIRVHYPSVRSLVQALQPYFRYHHHLAVGLFIPPSYLQGWASRHAGFLNAMNWVDSKVRHWPVLRDAGDHYLIHLERL